MAKNKKPKKIKITPPEEGKRTLPKVNVAGQSQNPPPEKKPDPVPNKPEESKEEIFDAQTLPMDTEALKKEMEPSAPAEAETVTPPAKEKIEDNQEKQTIAMSPSDLEEAANDFDSNEDSPSSKEDIFDATTIPMDKKELDKALKENETETKDDDIFNATTMAMPDVKDEIKPTVKLKKSPAKPQLSPTVKVKKQTQEEKADVGTGTVKLKKRPPTTSKAKPVAKPSLSVNSSADDEEEEEIGSLFSILSVAALVACLGSVYFLAQGAGL